MTQPKPPPIANVVGASHAAIDVSDIDRAVAFYRRVLGLEIFRDDRAGGEPPNIKGMVGSFAIELAERIGGGADPGAVRTPEIGAPCIAFTVTDAQAAFDRLRSEGVATGPRINNVRGVKFFYVYDPDGYPFELIEFPDGARTLGDLRGRFQSGERDA